MGIFVVCFPVIARRIGDGGGARQWGRFFFRKKNSLRSDTFFLQKSLPHYLTRWAW